MRSPVSPRVRPARRRAGRRERLRDDLVVGIGLAALEAVALPEAREPKGPLVQLLAPLAQRLLEGLVGTGDEAVERDRDVADELRHRSASDVPVSSSSVV